ncbi:MAG: hypothetical protein PWQ70_2732 [Clostridiales bacterium]|nr:hypothetical protein [Clostridiales bacterium]
MINKYLTLSARIKQELSEINLSIERAMLIIFFLKK